jgi:hypothetical protein
MWIPLLFAQIASLTSFSSPGYPPNAVAGATIVVEVRYAPGAGTEVRLLGGEGAFAQSAIEALQKWKFAAKEKGSVTVVVHFRDPNLYSTGSATRTVDPSPRGVSLAYPQSVVDPRYPPDSLADGSVILQADISPEGAVSGIESIQAIGGLKDASIDAVRSWRFQPSRDASGRAVPAKAYVVIVFRTPVNAPSRRP